MSQPVNRLFYRNGFARPWPEGQPRQRGERCELSDLLVSQCACRVHAKPEPSENDDAEVHDLDFS